MTSYIRPVKFNLLADPILINRRPGHTLNTTLNLKHIFLEVKRKETTDMGFFFFAKKAHNRSIGMVGISLSDKR